MDPYNRNCPYCNRAVVISEERTTRNIGNIGAPMEREINLIIDVDPEEAELLIGFHQLTDTGCAQSADYLHRVFWNSNLPPAFLRAGNRRQFVLPRRSFLPFRSHMNATRLMAAVGVV